VPYKKLHIKPVQQTLIKIVPIAKPNIKKLFFYIKY